MEQQTFIQAVAAARPRIVRLAAEIVGPGDDAEDVAQEVLLRLWMVRERMDSADDMLRLATVVTRNTALNWKRQRLRRTVADLGRAQLMAHNRTPETEQAERDNARLLEKAANSIPDRHRAVLRMRNVEGLSFSEIAAVMGVAESTVRSMLARARQEMMMRIKKLKELTGVFGS